MRTVRRIYFYAVALISLEVLLWGLISLARSIFCSELVICGGLGAALAQGLALVLVGVPVFGFHWLMAQRFARQEMEERSSGIRAAFLYSVLLGTLIPVVQNILALVNRPALTAMRLAGSRALVGGTQSWSDNLIAIVLNLLVAAYFLYILRGDWQVIQPKDPFANLRRIYRWFWTIYGLGLTVVGVDQILRFLMFTGSNLMGISYQRYWAVNGIVAALVGAPVWVYSWLTIQRSLGEQAERESLLRLGLLYLISLTGVVVTLSSGGAILDALLRLIFGTTASLPDLIQKIDDPLAMCIPFLGIWLYYGRWLNRTMAEAPDAPRRAGMRRVYAYILSALGVGITFVGLALLQSLIVDLVLAFSSTGKQVIPQLSDALTLLLIGLPLWLLSWRPMQAEAFARDDSGDHARRSLTRRIYLYLALFAGVIGGMVTAVGLLNTLLSALFAGDTSGLAREVLKFINMLILFVGLGVYHGLTMRGDGRISASALSNKHAAFPVLVFDPGDGFGAVMLAALQKATPSLPVTLQAVDKSPASSVSPLAVVLPSDLALDLPAPLRKWLDKFSGTRLVVPRPAGRWTLVGQPRNLPVNQAVLALRQLAEGQETRTSATPGWLIAVYVAATLVGLPILVSLIGTLVSAFMR
jgi:hypothetical protein